MLDQAKEYREKMLEAVAEFDDQVMEKYLNGQELGHAQLAAKVEELLGDSPAGERTVMLKVHREATAIYYEPVIEAISEAGGDLVHILEEKRE